MRLMISSNFFLVPVAHDSSFLTPSADTQFQGEPLKPGALNARRWENFAIFELNSRLSRKRYEIADGFRGHSRSSLIGSHRWRIDPCRFRWPWVTSKIEMREIKFFTSPLITHWYRFTLNDQIQQNNTWGIRVFLVLDHSPSSRGRCPSAANFLGFSCIYAYSL